MNTMLINKKLATAITTGAIVMSTFSTTAFASTSAGDIGNGAESTNTTSVTQTNNAAATQNNTATITNVVTSKSSTGGNNANFNTDGDTTINTGAASNGVSISNTANNNQITLPSFNNGGNTLLENDNNGAFSTNKTKATTDNTATTAQNNEAVFSNTVDSTAATGHNSAGDNTGGDTTIKTGAASNGVGIFNAANQNSVTGNGSMFGFGDGASLDNSGNGAESDNNITDTNNNSATATQANSAIFANVVSGGAFTGKNKDDFNTDGGTTINTGAATNQTGVSNMANVNIIDQTADCGCAIATPFVGSNDGNGSFSDNKTTATTTNAAVAGQENAAAFSNLIDPSAFSGKNSAADETGSFLFGGTNTVVTGAANSQTVVENSSNQNGISGDGTMFGGINFQFDPATMWGQMFGGI